MLKEIPRNRSFLFVIIISFICLIMSYVNYIYPTVIYSFLAILCLFVFLSYIAVDSPEVVLPLLPFIFIRVTELISGLLIESGGYLTETNILGQVTASFCRLVIYYVLFYFSVERGYFFIKKIKGDIKSEYENVSLSKIFIFSSLIFVVFVLLIGLVSGFKDGFAFLLGISRFAFRDNSTRSLLSVFLNNRTLAVLLVSILYSCASSSMLKKISLLLFVAITFISILHGEQFASMIMLLLTFSYPILLLESKLNKLVINKIFKYGCISLLLSSLAVLIIYSNLGIDLEAFAEKRLLLQGQQWYMVDTDEEIGVFSAHLDSFIRNLPSFFHLNIYGFIDQLIPYGMRELMYVYATPNIYNAYIDNFVTFTMGQMAMLLYWFGYLGMLPWVVLTGVLFSAVIFYLNHAIFKRDLISIILASKLFSWYVFGLQQGEYWYLWGAKTILFVFVIYLFEKKRKVRFSF